ncbi:hypothetical protein THAOC_32917, partial [Thalassiosira oceanica]
MVGHGPGFWVHGGSCPPWVVVTTGGPYRRRPRTPGWSLPAPNGSNAPAADAAQKGLSLYKHSPSNVTLGLQSFPFLPTNDLPAHNDEDGRKNIAGVKLSQCRLEEANLSVRAVPDNHQFRVTLSLRVFHRSIPAGQLPVSVLQTTSPILPHPRKDPPDGPDYGAWWGDHARGPDPLSLLLASNATAVRAAGEAAAGNRTADDGSAAGRASSFVRWFEDSGGIFHPVPTGGGGLSAAVTVEAFPEYGGYGLALRVSEDAAQCDGTEDGGATDDADS